MHFHLVYAGVQLGASANLLAGVTAVASGTFSTLSISHPFALFQNPDMSFKFVKTHKSPYRLLLIFCLHLFFVSSFIPHSLLSSPSQPSLSPHSPLLTKMIKSFFQFINYIILNICIKFAVTLLIHFAEIKILRIQLFFFYCFCEGGLNSLL